MENAKDTHKEKGWPEVQRRRHFRIVYPQGAQVTFKTEFGNVTVVDISEEGVRFVPSILMTRQQPGYLQGKLNLYCGESVTVRGKIIRQDAYMTVKMSKPLPYKLVHKEERLIIQKFRSKVKQNWQRSGSK